jgi:hypothetical protein
MVEAHQLQHMQHVQRDVSDGAAHLTHRCPPSMVKGSRPHEPAFSAAAGVVAYRGLCALAKPIAAGAALGAFAARLALHPDHEHILQRSSSPHAGCQMCSWPAAGGEVVFLCWRSPTWVHPVASAAPASALAAAKEKAATASAFWPATPAGRPQAAGRRQAVSCCPPASAECHAALATRPGSASPESEVLLQVVLP